MKTIEFRVTSSEYTPYLHTCYMLAPGKAPILICEDAFFVGLVNHLAFLVNTQLPDWISDSEFAEHLLKITNSLEYRFIMRTFDVEEFCQHVIAHINDDEV